jgi:hypothetical protein
MWTELHEYNEDYLYAAVDELGSSRVVLYHDGMYFPLDHISASIHTLAKYGGYYYYIVPRIVLP